MSDPLDNPPVPPAPQDSPSLAEELPVPSVESSSAGPGAADPIAAPISPAPPPRFDPSLSEDLRTPWSWPHLIIFVVFTVGSFFFLQIALFAYLTVIRGVSLKELASNPSWLTPYLVATQILVSIFVLLFLYLTTRAMHSGSFWQLMGWRSFRESQSSVGGRVFAYLASGAILSFAVNIVNGFVHPRRALPIEKLFMDRNGAALLLLLAVLVAPFVEETVFRGYLFPIFAREFGKPAGIIITGILFGLVHGAQLGWTIGLVSLLTVVGIVFTYARARAKTVLASYLLHLGYNSTIAIALIVGTKGLRHFPGGN
jgi:membrane protease YdiL (CAAX protease family)